MTNLESKAERYFGRHTDLTIQSLRGQEIRTGMAHMATSMAAQMSLEDQ